MHKHDDGFTLIEALLATALTLIVVGAGLSAFTKGMDITDTARIISETNQSLQVAESLMVRDFIQIGQGIPRGGIPIPTGDGSVAIVRPAQAGAALTFPAAWATMPAAAPGGSSGPVVLGVTTDIVTMLYADSSLFLNQYQLVAVAADGSSMTVDNRTSITTADGLKVGDVILFTNALGNAMQTVTQTNNNQTVNFALNDTIGFNQRGAAQGTIMNIQAGGVFPPTTATRVLMISYYVDLVTDPTLPRLMRQVNGDAPRAIALGVENLQLTYDFIDSVGNPTNQESVPAANSPNQIRKVNLFMSARSLDLNTHTRQYYRNTVATQIGLRSLSFMDRYR
jgi:type II secretory pathway pseudopilin PulG